MAGYRLIDTYLDDLASSMRWHRDVDAIVAETDDHLRCAVEQQVGEGIDAGTAQREVLERFGDPAVVARAYATTSRGRLALPTRSTKDAGAIAFIGASLWVALPVVWLGCGWLYDRLDNNNRGTDELGNPAQVILVGVMIMTLLSAAGTLLVTMMTLRERHGGFGPLGMVGIVATGLGTPAALFGWFYMGWGSLLIAGTILVAIDMWRRDIAPRRAVLATGAGLAIGGLTWGVLRFMEVGSPDRFGDYPIATAAWLTIGPVVLAIGLAEMGRWLAGEEPVELPINATG